MQQVPRATKSIADRAVPLRGIVAPLAGHDCAEAILRICVFDHRALNGMGCAAHPLDAGYGQSGRKRSA
jgi:hypothetical protein